MNRILCPTDFSSSANNAIAYAAKFAQASESEIVLFHVQSIFELTPGELFKGKSDRVEKVKSILEAQALEVATEFDISCYADLQVSGSALPTLIKNVAAQFDLIVMGTNGPDDLYQFFAGSNTYNVVRESTVPVLFIPEKASFSAPGLAVLAYDYLREGMPPVEQTHRFLNPFDCELRILQLLEESDSQLQEAELKGRQGLIANLLSRDIKVSFDSIHTDNTAHAIEVYMNGNNADMLILNLKHYSMIKRIFHKSVTKALSVIADFPVLVIHS